MSKNETGGNAFPFEGTHSLRPSNGMSLRDYFAAKAMQALIATVGPNASRAEEAVCGVAYLYADQLLRQRDMFIDYDNKGE